VNEWSFAVTKQTLIADVGKQRVRWNTSILVYHCVGVNFLLFVDARAVRSQQHLVFFILNSDLFRRLFDIQIVYVCCCYGEWIMHNAIIVFIQLLSAGLRATERFQEWGCTMTHPRHLFLFSLLSGLSFVTPKIQFSVNVWYVEISVVVLGLDPWPWAVLEDKFWVLGLGLGLEGQVLGLGQTGPWPCTTCDLSD